MDLDTPLTDEQLAQLSFTVRSTKKGKLQSAYIPWNKGDGLDEVLGELYSRPTLRNLFSRAFDRGKEIGINETVAKLAKKVTNLIADIEL